MASSDGLEPTTLWLTAKCSNRLSYGDAKKKKFGDYRFSLEVNLSILGVNRLNYWVRNVSRCIPVAIITKLNIYIHR